MPRYQLSPYPHSCNHILKKKKKDEHFKGQDMKFFRKSLDDGQQMGEAFSDSSEI